MIHSAAVPDMQSDNSSQSCPADCKNQAQTFTSREQITAALTALKAAQGKLQLKGKLLDAFKDEEAKLEKQK